MRKSKFAGGARDYLSLQRKLTDQTIDQFAIGYAPDSWDACIQALKKRGITDARLVESGLAIRRDKGQGIYDRFRNRIMFPIRDAHGAVVGFGGRAMDPNEPAKYINTPQTLVYNKSAVLYGLDLAKPEIRKQKVAVIVEGYMDCVASHQAGITNVVASSGTALTDGQVLLLKRYTPTAALAFDMDPAGETAAKRGIAVAWREGVDVKVISLPFGKDPDECIKQDPGAWAVAIGKAQPILEFYFSRTLDVRDQNNVQHKKEAAKILLPILSTVADNIEQTHYLQKLAQWLNVDEHILRRKIEPSRPGAPKPEEALEPRQDRHILLAQRLLGLLQLEPSAMPTVSGQLPVDALPGVWQNLYKFVLLQYSEGHTQSVEAWRTAASQSDPTIADALAVAALAVTDLATASSVERHRELDAVVREIARLWLTRELTQVTQAIRQTETQKNHAALTPLTTRFTELTERLRKI